MLALALLLAILALAAFGVFEIAAFAAFLLSVLGSLLAAHLDREGGQIAETLVRGAVKLLPAERREEERDEWLDHLDSAGEAGVRPLTRALSIAFIAAPLLAVGLRIGRRRRATR